MSFLVQFWDSITRMFTQFWESVLLAAGNYDLLLDTLDIALIAYIIYKEYRSFVRPVRDSWSKVSCC